MVPTKKQARAELARRNIRYFAEFINKNIQLSDFHITYYKILESFARGNIKKLIVTIPPQHGKSLGSSIITPAYILGINPEARIAIASYNLSLASKFNRQIQRVIDNKNYTLTFPETRLKKGNEKGYIRTAEEFEIVGTGGGVIAVGREGALTGNPVDIMIIDDLYKDAMEANSPVVRDNAWNWYTSVVKTRLHNESRELIVFTRWHEDDLIGRIAKNEPIIEITDFLQLENGINQHCWYRLNFEAIKESPPTAIDPRPYGAALWREKQSETLLEGKRSLDRAQFACMYQGQPIARDMLLYGNEFQTYTSIPIEKIIKKGNYTDTADSGEDFLCSICYDVSKEGVIYVTDIVYTQQTMEFTEESVAAMLNRNATRVSYIESNNGGRGFARNVEKLADTTKIEWFFQGFNKESRILTNAPNVLKHIVMPADWKNRWGDFFGHITSYRRTFRANKFHDAADVLTGIIEKEIFSKNTKGVHLVKFSR